MRVTLSAPISGAERLGYEMAGFIEITPQPGVIDGPVHRILAIGCDWLDVEANPYTAKGHIDG